MLGHASGNAWDPIYVRQESTSSGIGLIAIPLLLLALYQDSRRAAAQAEMEAARWREWKRRERARRRAARREWECWVLEKKREWRAYVKELEAEGHPEPRYEEAEGSKYGISLPGYPREVVEFAEREAERGIYSGACVQYGQLWQWDLKPETIRRVRRMVREAVQHAVPQTVLDDARTMCKSGAENGTIEFAGRIYRWVKTGPSRLKFIEVTDADYDFDDNYGREEDGRRRRRRLMIVVLLLATLVTVIGLLIIFALWPEVTRQAPVDHTTAADHKPAENKAPDNVKAADHKAADQVPDEVKKIDSFEGTWVGVDSKNNRQVVSLDKDGSFSAGVVRNGKYQFTIFGRYEHTGDELTLSFRNGGTERGKVVRKDKDVFSYKVVESTNSKLAVGKTIEYTRLD